MDLDVVWAMSYDNLKILVINNNLSIVKMYENGLIIIHTRSHLFYNILKLFWTISSILFLI